MPSSRPFDERDRVGVDAEILRARRDVVPHTADRSEI